MTKLSILALPLLAGGLLLSGCVVEESGVVYDDGPAYSGGYYAGPNPDFYYAGDSPYSRQYGVLFYRDGGYYYRRNNTYVVYGRPAWSRYDYDRYRRDNWRSYRSRHDTRVIVREDRRHDRHVRREDRRDDRRHRDTRVVAKDTRKGTQVTYATNKTKKDSAKKSNNNNGNKKNKNKNKDEDNKKKKKKN